MKRMYMSVVVPLDAYHQLKWLANDVDTSMSRLLREGLVMTLARHGECPPDSLAHLLTKDDRKYLVACGVDKRDLPKRSRAVKP